VINEVPLERYVAGTVPAEIYTSWPDAVLRAQAVVTRTYALHQRERARDAACDVTADISSQHYAGLGSESPEASGAVHATRGEYLSYQGEPILAVYHSASGGRTASAEEVWGQPLPYLVSVEVEGEEDSPDTYWRTTLVGSTLERALAEQDPPLGSIHQLRVAERTGSGRVRSLTVDGAGGSLRLGGGDLRRLLGLARVRSTLFEVRPVADGFVIVGSGRGHGVGMSQWGARGLAEAGAGYREILDHFYPGTRLERLGGEPASVDSALSDAGGG
jgi:stage II sporulation protein D